MLNQFKNKLHRFVPLLIILTAHLVVQSIADAATMPMPVGAYSTATKSQLCIAGYSSNVRPSTSYTSRIKNKLVRKWGGKVSDFELDHYMPIGLGGNPASLDNLWLQSWTEAKRKDVLENKLHRDVCANKIPLNQAQQQILNWK